MPGWLPIEILLDQHPEMVWPGLLPEADVRWAYFGDQRLTEPFFSQSVARLREGARPAWEMQTSIQSIMREAGQLPRSMPNGFIFHVSRCGSTLVSNAFKVLDGLEVVAEARPITRLFMPCRPSEPALVSSSYDPERKQLAECLFSLFSSYRTGKAEPIIVKFTSQNSLSLETIRRFWPEIPCLFVIREPVAVMVSNLRDGGLDRFTESPALACDMCAGASLSSVGDMSTEEFCARVLGRYFNALAPEVGPSVRVIDYDDISPDSICDIMEFFGLRSPSDPSCLRHVFKRYSKDPAGARSFSGDKADKLRAATPRIRSAADRWALPLYGYLRSCSTWKRRSGWS
jgi:hypothetical protein